MNDSLTKPKRLIILFLLGTFFILSIFFSSYNYLISFAILVLLFIIFIFFLSPEFILYLLAIFLPVIGIKFYFKSLELPFIDLLALLALSSFLIRYLYLYFFFNDSKPKIKLPLWGPFFLFFAIALVSSFLSQGIWSSLWYTCRWILFFYLAFVVFPFNVISDLKILRRVLILLSFSGLLVAIMGLSSLFFQDWSDSFFRVQPLYLFGFWIFGENYNLLAEFLVISIFIVLSLKYWARSDLEKRILNFISLFITIITLLTFGRTAWIVVFLQLALFLLIESFVIKKRKFSLSQIIVSVFIIIILLAPFIVRMLSLQEANVSSTENRLLLTQISWKAFQEKPFFGYGSGIFVSLVENNVRFVAKYGDPLDSHGFGQKVLAENGGLGLISFLLFLFFIFRRMYLGLVNNKEHYQLLLPLLIASFGAYFYQIFNTSYYKGRIWFPIAITLAATEIIYKLKDKKKNEEKI